MGLKPLEIFLLLQILTSKVDPRARRVNPLSANSDYNRSELFLILLHQIVDS